MRVLLLSFALLTVVAGSSQAQSRLEAQYKVTLAGITIGKGQWLVDVNGTRYTAAASGKTSGFLSYLSNGQGNSTATGTLMGSHVLSSTYAGTIIGDKKRSNVRLTIKNGDVKEFQLNPPPDNNPGRVPVIEPHRQGILDPMSASIVPVPGNGEFLSAEACKRKLPIFDGWLRYDLQFAFKRMDHVKTEKGYAGPAVVCTVYFSPIAGHIPSRFAIKYLANLREAEIWLAPVAGTRLLVPIRAEMPTPLGHAVLMATQFVSVATSKQAASSQK